MATRIPGFFPRAATDVGREELEAVQNKLRQAYGQIEDLRVSLVAQLLEARKWAAAVPLLETLIEDKQKRVAEAESRSDNVEAANCSRQLWSYNCQLGKAYLELQDLPKAEQHTRKAYLGHNTGVDKDATVSSEMQLCTICRRMGNGEKIAEAAKSYHNRWANDSNDELTLECGHQLGCLHYERGEYGFALPLFQRVWELRRNHNSVAEQQKAMSTVELLLAILVRPEQNKATEREFILEQLWAQHTGDLSGTPMLEHGDSLAFIYFKAKKDTRAEPILASLWEARSRDLANYGFIRNERGETVKGAWFVTGYRYAVVLTGIGGDERHRQADNIFEQLWTSRAQLPSTVSDTVNEVRLADHYAQSLLYSHQYKAVVKIAGPVFNKLRETTDWELNTRNLNLGETYAKALIQRQRLDGACTVYELLFAAWKRQAEAGDKDSVSRAKRTGHALLAVLREAGNQSKKCKKVEAEIEQLKLLIPRRNPRQLTF